MSEAAADLVSLKVPDIGDADKIELVAWHVTAGDTVSDGQELCELVTDKAAFPLESPHDGRIAKILEPVGSVVSVGQTLAKLIPVD